MAAVLENIQKARLLPTRPLGDELPTYQGSSDNGIAGLRKRLSALSVNIQPFSSASTEWAFRRSKSAPSLGAFAGGPLKRWWEWGVGWILSRKPAFAGDLEMNEEETAALGRHSKGSWGHIFYKATSGIRRLLASSDTLPTTQRFQYNSTTFPSSQATFRRDN